MDFRVYLEQARVTESLTRAMTALYQKLSQPTTKRDEIDPVIFIADHLFQQHAERRTS